MLIKHAPTHQHTVILTFFCLLFRLRDFSEWGQCQVLQLLLRYKASDEEEVFDLLV